MHLNMHNINSDNSVATRTKIWSLGRDRRCKGWTALDLRERMNPFAPVCTIKTLIYSLAQTETRTKSSKPSNTSFQRKVLPHEVRIPVALASHHPRWHVYHVYVQTDLGKELPNSAWFGNLPPRPNLGDKTWCNGRHVRKVVHLFRRPSCHPGWAARPPLINQFLHLATNQIRTCLLLNWLHHFRYRIQT